jgi:protein CpxP
VGDIQAAYFTRRRDDFSLQSGFHAGCATDLFRHNLEAIGNLGPLDTFRYIFMPAGHPGVTSFLQNALHAVPVQVRLFLSTSRKEIAMKSNQGSFMKRAVLAGLIAGSGILAASAYAVSSDQAGDKPRCESRQMQKGDAGREGKRDAHLTGLKEKLQLSAEQQAAWNAFAGAAQPGSRQQGMDRKAMRGEFEKLSTPERLDRMQSMAEKRHARMAERAETIKAFYAQLTPEQQKVFDAEAMPRGHQGGQHKHRRHS